MSYNAVLTDRKDEQVLPITTAENVFYSGSKTVKQAIDEIEHEGVIVDENFSTTSEHPLMNKSITNAFELDGTTLRITMQTS